MKKIEVELTKRGYPALWERGGGMTNTGDCQLIAGPNGEPKKPVYVRQRGPLANDDHALFIVSKGDLVIEADHHRKDFNIKMWRIFSFSERFALLELVNSYSQGEWDRELDDRLRPVVDAAREKATCYHCRSPFWMNKI